MLAAVSIRPSFTAHKAGIVMKKALVIDYKYCDQCNSCIIACKNEKNLEGDEWGIKVQEIGPEMIDGKWMWNYLPYVSNRCDLCEERVAEGKKPSCVQHCLSACMELVELEKLPKRLEELDDTVAVYIP